jgi:hypothetical protein
MSAVESNFEYTRKDLPGNWSKLGIGSNRSWFAFGGCRIFCR